MKRRGSLLLSLESFIEKVNSVPFHEVIDFSIRPHHRRKRSDRQLGMLNGKPCRKKPH